MKGQYTEAFYFITTVISTVGYGAPTYRGYDDNSGSWTAEMIYLCVVTTCGIGLFSLVTHQIFDYKKLLTVKELVKKHVKGVDLYLH